MAAYTNAALSGQGPWTNSTSTWGAGTGTSATISATALSYTGYGTFPKSTSFQSGDSPGAPFLATAATTGSYYFAFLVKFSVVSTATTNTYGQFFRLRDKAGSASVPARVCAYNLSSGSFKFSVTKNNASNDVAPLTYALSSTHLVIMKYTINPGAADDVVDLFIDPTAGGSEPTPTVSTITGADQFATANQLQGFLIYNGFNSGSSNTSGQMAGFRVGTTWAALFPTCFAPTSVAVSSVTTTTAQLTWGSPSAGTAPTNYDYEINTTGTFTGTPTVSGVSSPVGLTGLMPNTPYYIRVRSNCGGGDFSSWTNTVTFTTLPTCPTPTTPTISNLISTSADLNWSTTVGTGQTTPLSYEYENITSAATFTTVATATGIAASPTTMTASGSAGSTAAMVQATAYKTKVRSNCGSGDFSPYSAQVAYTTTCAVTNLSLGTYTEGFNTPGVLNPCWSTAIVTTGSATDIAVAATMTQPSGTRYEGSGVVYFKSFNLSAGLSSRLISPTFSTMGMSGLELNFAATENYNTSYTGADKATVEYSTDGGTTWVAVSDYFRENTTLTSAATYNLRNNIFVTARTGGSGIHSALRLPALTSGSLSGLTCNYNAFNGVVLVYEGTISRTTFAAWQGNAGGYDAALGYVCHGSLHRRCLERNRCNKRFL